jgi:division protein CdvB (Snf7/Vps24/ESCRT-III family)
MSSDPPSKTKPPASPAAAAATAKADLGDVLDSIEQHIDDKKVVKRIEGMMYDIIGGNERHMSRLALRFYVAREVAIGLLNMHVENLVEQAALLPEALGDKVDKVVERMKKVQMFVDKCHRLDYEEIKEMAGEERAQHEQIECMYSNVSQWLPRVEALLEY